MEMLHSRFCPDPMDNGEIKRASMAFSSQRRMDQWLVPPTVVKRRSPVQWVLISIELRKCFLQGSAERMHFFFFYFFFENYNLFFFFLKMNILPWLVCLSWLEHHPSTEESRVQSPVRVHAWVMGLVSSRDAYDRQLIDVSLALAFLSLSLSLPSSPSGINGCTRDALLSHPVISDYNIQVLV